MYGKSLSRVFWSIDGNMKDFFLALDTDIDLGTPRKTLCV